MRLFLLGFAILFLFGCGAVPYKKMGSGGVGKVPTGYEDVEVAKNLYRVKFQGNGNNTSTEVYQMFLRRAAEVTAEKGGTHFLVENGQANNFDNVGVQWPAYEGNVKVLNSPQEDSMAAKEILAKWTD
jgi:hypothetical protein